MNRTRILSLIFLSSMQTTIIVGKGNESSSSIQPKPIDTGAFLTFIQEQIAQGHPISPKNIRRFDLLTDRLQEITDTRYDNLKKQHSQVFENLASYVAYNCSVELNPKALQ